MKGIILTLIFISTQAMANTGIKKATEFKVPETGIVLKGNLTIVKDIVHINGPILTNGHRLKIVADEINFSDEGAIYGFYNSLVPTELEACYESKDMPDPRANHYTDQPPDYQTAAPGATGSSQASTGQDGADGKKGFLGTQGQSGKLVTEPIIVLANKINGTVKIHGHGEEGGDGGQGGKGSNGQRGQKGGKGWAECEFLSIFGVDRISSGNGGHGGAGGAGGNGGKAGLGGTNPEVFVITTNKLKGDEHVIKSYIGESGAGGEPGPHGTHGPAGAKGDNHKDRDEIKFGFGSITTCEVNSGQGQNGGQFNLPSQLIGYPAEYGEEIGKGCWNMRTEEGAVTKFSISVNDASDLKEQIKKINIFKRLFISSYASLKFVGRFPSVSDMMANGTQLSSNNSLAAITRLKAIWKNLFQKKLNSSDYRDVMVNESLKVANTMDEVFTLLEEGSISEAQSRVDRLTSFLKSNLITQADKTGRQCLTFKENRQKSFDSFDTIKGKYNKPKYKDAFRSCILTKSKEETIPNKMNEFINRYQAALPQRADLLSISAIPFCDDFTGLNSTSPQKLLAFSQKDIPLRTKGKNSNPVEYFTPDQCSSASLTKSLKAVRNLASDNIPGFQILNSLSSRKRLARLYTTNDSVVGGLTLTKLPAIKLNGLTIEDLEKEILLTAVMLGGFK